jgi:hypothetical protein
MSKSGHERPIKAYVWQVRSGPRKARRHGPAHAMNVRQRWLRAPATNTPHKKLPSANGLSIAAEARRLGRAHAKWYGSSSPAWPRCWLTLSSLVACGVAGAVIVDVVVQRTPAKRMFAASELPSASPLRETVFSPRSAWPERRRMRAFAARHPNQRSRRLGAFRAVFRFSLAGFSDATEPRPI